MKDASQVAEKWNRNIKGATETIKQGVARVDTAPTEKAAAAKEKMKQKLIEAIDNGDWEAGLKAVSLEDWKQAMDKGVGRIAAGADMAQPKMKEFMDEFLPHLEQGKAKIDKMPNVSLEDGINRAAEMIRHNAAFKKRK